MTNVSGFHGILPPLTDTIAFALGKMRDPFGDLTVKAKGSVLVSAAQVADAAKEAT